MYELTMGDQRYIADATTAWKMYVNPILVSMESVPKTVSDRIKELEESYISEFWVYYREAMDKDDTLLAGEVQRDFEEEWTKKHPEYYDMDLLFKGCSKTALKKAETAMAEAKEAFQKG